jgi:hypothetical protein
MTKVGRSWQPIASEACGLTQIKKPKSKRVVTLYIKYMILLNNVNYCVGRDDETVSAVLRESHPLFQFTPPPTSAGIDAL